jgi:(2R)-sulfolactate sulfo-lyase subunit alpha
MRDRRRARGDGAEGLQEAAAGEHATRIPASSLEPAMIHFVVHEEGDGVGVVVVEGVKAGQELDGWIMEDDKDIKVTARNDIPIGHKLALQDYREGDTVIKYGVDIGKVVQPIRKGEHLHVHNVKTKRW